jgi:esterase/lipase superfamily enzyme
MVAPDVDLDAFRVELQRMGSFRPHIFLFVSRDDEALRLSQFIWGGAPRLGRQCERDRIEVFDLILLKSTDRNAHDRAFDEPRRGDDRKTTEGGPRTDD